jgi:hypothetical protein
VHCLFKVVYDGMWMLGHSVNASLFTLFHHRHPYESPSYNAFFNCR